MNQKTFSLLNVTEERRKIVSTFFIPDEHWDLFERYKSKLGKNTGEFLEYLLENFQEAKDLKAANQEKLTTHYQDEGLHLQKHNFLVHPLVWHRFKCLARFYGISMCRLFVVFLLALEFIGTPKNKICPLIVKSFEKVKIPFKSAVRIYKIQIFADTS